MNTRPATLDEAVSACMKLLSTEQVEELARVGYVDPHTRYHTDFERIVVDALQLNHSADGELERDVVTCHSHLLNFLESDSSTAEPAAILRVVLAEMVKRARLSLSPRK